METEDISFDQEFKNLMLEKLKAEELVFKNSFLRNYSNKIDEHTKNTSKTIPFSDELLEETAQILGTGSFNTAFEYSNGSSNFVIKRCNKILKSNNDDYIIELEEKLRDKITENECELQRIVSFLFIQMMKELNLNIISYNKPILIKTNKDFDKTNPNNEIRSYMVENKINDNFRTIIFQNGCSNKNNLDEKFQKIQKICEAFVHYTWERSKGNFLVADIQGSFIRLTDACIHSLDGKSGLTDFGEDGIISCAIHHECNKYCKILKLELMNLDSNSKTQMAIIPIKSKNRPKKKNRNKREYKTLDEMKLKMVSREYSNISKTSNTNISDNFIRHISLKDPNSNNFLKMTLFKR